jgi:hypothetical protein
MIKKIVFSHLDREALVDEIIWRQYREMGTRKQEGALFEYAETGDIEKFISEGGPLVDQYSIFYIGGNATLEALKQRLQLFWDDVVDNPEKYKGQFRFESHKTLADWFSIWPSGLLTSRNGYFFSNELFAEVFFWMFGESFQAERDFPMSFGSAGNRWTPKLHIDANRYGHRIRSEARRFFFDMSRSYDVDPGRIKPILDYYVSLVPHISQYCYSKTLIDRKELDSNGVLTSRRSHQHSMRDLLAKSLNVLREGEKERGFTQVIVSESEELRIFLDKVESVTPFLDDYHALVEFIKESGSEFRYASEES